MRITRHLVKLVLSAAVLLPAAAEVQAQTIDVPLIITSPRGPKTAVRAVYFHQFNTDVEKSPAEFSRDNASFTVVQRFELDDDWYLLGGAVYRGAYYDFAKGTAPGSTTGISAQLRWSDIHEVNLLAGVGWKASDKWTLSWLLIGQTAGESGAKFSDTITGGGAFAVDYAWSDDLSTGFILGAMTQLEDQANLIPVPTIRWRFADDWRFNFGIVAAAGRTGVGPELAYDSKDYFFGVGASYQRSRFRLDSDSGQTPPGSASKGIGDEQKVPVFVRFGFRPTEKSTVAAVVGASFAGQLRSGREGGGKIFKEDYKPAPIVGLQANIGF